MVAEIVDAFFARGGDKPVIFSDVDTETIAPPIRQDGNEMDWNNP
jgi:hypothetical protein